MSAEQKIVELLKNNAGKIGAGAAIGGLGAASIGNMIAHGHMEDSFQEMQDERPLQYELYKMYAGGDQNIKDAMDEVARNFALKTGSLGALTGGLGVAGLAGMMTKPPNKGK